MSLARFASAVAVAGALSAGVGSAMAADRFWDPFFSGSANGGGTGTWDHLVTANWWDGAADVVWNNANLDTAIFGGASAGTVTLGSPIVVGGLTFNTTGYTLAGSNTLTLTPPSGLNSPLITVNGLGTRATIDSLIAGTSGFTKTGNGALQLANSSNSFSGDVAITEGSLVITSAAQLGTGTTAIGVTGIANTGNPGFSGGSLVLAGTTPSGGFTLSREISFSGRGPGAVNNSGGLISVGYNTIAGGMTLGSGASEGRASASHGITTVSGGVNLGTGGGNIFQGNGNWIISGQVTGSEVSADRLIKSGNVIATTLWLQNANNSFAEAVRIDSGTVRVSTNSALGRNLGTQSLDLNNGRLEVRSDAPDFATRNINLRAFTNGQVFVSRAIGGSGLNQNFAFGNFNPGQQATFTAEGRDGNNMSITGPVTNGVPGIKLITWAAGGNGLSLTNNTNGTFTIDASLTRASETTARTLTITSTGDMVLTGSVLQGAGTGAISLSKGGLGTFTIQGTASTATGATTINDGTLSISSFGALPTGSVNIGNATTTPGALTYTGSGQTVSNNILLNSTTAPVYINASGTGALTLTGSIQTTVTGAKTLVLGGTNTADNTITAVYANSGTNVHSLQKIGAGSWVLAGTANNTFTGSTTISNGVLKLQEAAGDFDILPNAGAVTFNVDLFTQSSGATLDYRGADGAASTETAGALTLATGANTIAVNPGAAGTAALTFASLGTRTAGATVNLTPATGGTVNFTAGPLGNDGILGGFATFKGVDWVNSGVAASQFVGYTTGLPVSGSTATANYLSDASVTTTAAQTVNSLKIAGPQTITLGGLLTVDTGGVLFDNSTGAALVTGSQLGANATEVIVTVNGTTPANALTIDSVISGTTGSLTKAGAGTLILGGANVNTGTVTINAGTLQLAGGTLGGTNVGLVVRQGATFDLNGGNVGSIGAGGANVLNGAGTITNSAAATTSILRVGNNNSAGYFSGLIQNGAGAVAFSKAGSGTVSLSGANTFSGGVTINGGVLAVTSLANIGSSSGIGTGDATNDSTNAASLVFNGGTLTYTGSTAAIYQTTQTPSVSINRLFTLAGDGAISSEGSTGLNRLGRANNNAALIFNHTAPVSFSGTGARTLTLQGDSQGDNEMRIQLINNGADALSLTKAGSGLWILNPSTSNTYTGATTINGSAATTAGVLQVGDDAGAGLGLPISSNLVLGAATGPGVLQTSGSFVRGVGTLPNQVQFGASGGGFAASTGKLTVNLGGAGADLVLGAAPTANSLIVLSSTTALADVELVNGINLGAAARTIQVDDNFSTGLDFATASGVITGAAGGTLTKTGGGTLILGNANTYVADTILNNGSLIVTSIGSGGASSSLGAVGGTLQMGAGTNTVNLMYVGPGESVTRPIALVGAAATMRIDASGSGALTIPTLTNTATGATTLEIRGTNTDGNIITSQLTNSGANGLTVTKADGGVWILNPGVANTFTGNINSVGGMLGLTANGVGSSPSVVLNNGGIFAFGGPLTIPATTSVQGNNSTAVFGGSNAITIDGNLIKTAGANDWTISNNLEDGALLTFNGNFTTTENTSRTINWRGNGSTVFNGIIANGTGTASVTLWNIALSNDASFTIAGSAGNTYSGVTTLSQGTLNLNKTGGVSNLGTGQLNFGGGIVQTNSPLTLPNNIFLTGDPATFDGTNSIELTGLLTNNAGNRTLFNSVSGGATLTVTGNVSLSNDNTARSLILRGAGDTIINGVVQNGGTGAGGLAYSANTGSLTLTGLNTATGALTANRNTITLSGANGRWAGSAVVNPLGVVTLDNSVVEANRLADAGAFTGQGGTLNFIGDANGTSETTGALTVNSVQTKIVMSGAGPNVLTFASVNFAATGSSLSLNGVPGLGTTNQVKFTAAPSTAPAVINGIMPRVYIGGTDFAEYSVANGVQAFTGYVTNINSATAAQTVESAAGASLTANRTINALKINGTGLTIGGATLNRLTLSAGAILNTGGNNTLSTPQVALGTTGHIQVQPGTTLTVDSEVFGTLGWAKALSGTLVLNTPTYISSTTNLLNGVTQLNGGLNTLFPNQLLNINDGATLDLNGNTQYVGQISDPGAMPLSGGTITTTTGTSTFVTNMAGSDVFSGQITGNVNLGRVNGNTWTINSAQSYTGSTLLMGGNTTLESDGTLLTTSAIDLNNAALILSNNTGLQTQNNNRVGDAIPITLRGGTVSYTGRVSTAATETLGPITATQGANTITANIGGGTFGSTDLTIASLTRTPGAGVVVNFTGSNLGQAGNNARIFFTTPLTTVAGGALGGWAIANTTDFAAYNTGLGVGVVGMGGFAGYDSAFGTGNITELPGAPNSTTTTLLPGNTTTGLLKFAGNTFNNLTFTAGGNVLDLDQGGLLRSNNNFGTSIGTAAIRGVLTAGGSDPTARELFVFNNGAANPTFGGAATTLGSPVVTGINTTGLQPGMTVTNANFPAGTTVLSVDNSGQAILSNNATATATAQTLTAGAIDLGATTINTPIVTMSSTVGLQPGMTITGTGIPAGSFISSVDSGTQLTISQNATATGGGLTITAGLSNMVINSVIADNTLGGAAVTLMKSGAGILTLTAPNTYTGGTIINSPLNLASPGTGGIATNIVLPAGGVTINNGTVTMLTNSGQINAANTVTLRGGSVMTLVGANSLNSLAFDNNGGTATPTVNSGGLLTLTNATPITVTSSNPLTAANIAGNIDIGTGAKTINVPAIQVAGATVTNISPTLNISAAILSPGVTLTKSGAGVLQLSGQSTFTGGLNVTGGGILISGNSNPTSGGAGFTGGPLGTGAVAMSAATTILVDGTRSIGNDIAFAGTPTFDSTANTVWTLNLNGAISGAGWSATPTVQINNPFLTVALLGDIGSPTHITKTGLGTLVFNSTNYTGSYDAAALGNGLAISLLHDGTGVNKGNSTPETIAVGSVTFDTIGVGTVTVGRAGGSLPFNLAANKIIAPSSINTVLTNGLIVANNTGYGLQVGDAGALVNTPTFTVNNATASNVTQGLYLTGALSGTGFNKAGAGTVVLGNAGNTFIGNVNIQQGVVSVNSDAQLGDLANNVRLNPTAGTSTLRATGTFATSRIVELAVATNLRAIEVTSGNTLTLNTGFGLTAAAAGLIKADLGTLELAAANGGWSGPLTITSGAVSTALATSLGTGTIIVNAPGAALQLNGGITVANPITIDSLVDNRTVSGINTRGAIQSVTGGNIISSAITVNASPTADNISRNFGFGADAGASLTFNGAINFNHPTGGTNRNVIIYLGGAGDLTLNDVLNNTNASPGANSFVFKNGNGTLTLTAANAIQDSEVRTYRGTILLDGAATFGTGATQVQAWQNGTLTLDNSTTNTGSRFSNRVVQIGGGTLNFIPNAAGTTHTSTGALQISSGANVINLAAGGNQTVTFASLAQNGGATLDLTGTFGTASNKLTFTTAPALVPAVNGLLARVTTNGNEFATYFAATGITTFTGYAPATNILSAGATQTYMATSATANSLTGNQTLNAINLKSGPLVGNVPNIGGLGGLNPTTLTLTSGGILANGTGAGANSILSVPIVALAGAEGILHVASGQTLDVTSGFSGTGGMTKSLGGTLNLNSQQFVSGNTTVNGGTLNLTPGATNTLLFNNGLVVNNGGTVDLKNGVQFISGLSSANGGGNTDLGGGTVTNSGAQATLVVNSNTNFNGQITGTIYLNKTGTGALNLQNANPYTGNTFITGGTVTLQDDGTLLSTPAIDINYGGLTLSNNTLRDNANRVNDAAPITMKGANLSFNGRAQTNSTETLGAVTLVEGHNSIFPGRADPGINSADLTLASLTRSVGSTATLRFNNLGSMGLIGSQSRVFVTTNPTLTNNIIGPWAIMDREYATYDATYGISALGQVGMAGYDGSSLNTSPLATDNVRHTATGTTILAGNTVVNTLNINNSTTNTIIDLGTNTLRLQGGGLLIGQNTDNITVAINNGTITSGTVGSPSDLYLIHAPFSNNGRAATIGAVIADNAPVTGPVRLIVSGGDTRPAASGLILNGTNTYTGGTVMNATTIVLGAAGTLGTGGITVNGATFVQTAGGVIPAQALTLGGSSVVTLAGANSLTGITFNNMGGAAPTLNPTGTLTLTGGIAVTTMNAGAAAIITNGTLDLNGAGSYSMNVGAAMVNGVDVAPWQSGLTINSVIDNGGIAKSGAGLLQLGGQSTFTGGVNVTAGGLILGASSTPSGLLDTVVTGPLGTGAVTMAANTTLVATVAASVSNNFTFLGDTVFNGIQNISLNGITTLPSTWNATISAPQMTVTIADASPSLSTDVINKSGLGALTVGNYAGTIQAAGGLVFTGDGNTLGTPESLSLGGNLVVTGDTAITVNRSGSAVNARNKTLQKTDLSISGNILSVSNQNGFGLEFTGGTTMTGPTHFAVGIATASNVVQGLTLSGVVSGAFDMTKSGPGTLVLGNAGNTFGGVDKTIRVLNGILSAGSDGALGNINNTVTLDVDGATGVGLRATGTFATGRTIILNQASNAIEVAAGNVFAINASFGLGSPGNSLTKNDNGVLELAAANGSWTGPLVINAGAIRLSNSSAAGTGTISVAPSSAAVGAALQLANNVTINNPLTSQGTGNQLLGGLNFGGQLQSVSGTNTYAGAITMPFDTAIGADAGSVLNVTGGVTNTGANHQLWFTGAGDINLSGTALAAGSGATGYFAIQKYGSGKLTISNANTVGISDATGFRVNAGEVAFKGAGTFAGAFSSTSGNYVINPGGTLTLDNTDAAGGNVNNRLGNGRLINFTGGNFNLIGNESVTTTETFGAPALSRGLSVITVTAPSTTAGANLVFTGSANVPTNAQNNTTGPTGASILFRGTNLGSAAGNGVATIKNTGSTNGFAFNGQNGATGTKSKGLMPYALVDTMATGSGISFATGDSGGTTNAGTIANVRPLAANEYETANSVVANNNILLNGGMTTPVPTGLTVNSITMDGGANLTLSAYQLLSLSSGGILVRSGSTSNLTGGSLNQTSGFSPLNIWTVGDLTIRSVLNGGNGQTNGAIGFVKAGAGILTLSTPTSTISGLAGMGVNTMSGQLVINQGILKLDGGTNTLMPNNYLALNGGTLDLNGTSQQVFSLFGDATVSGAGGTITSSTGMGNFVVNQDNAGRNWAGAITGAVNFTRSGQNTLTLYSPQTYSGSTVFNGGTTVLRDGANLSNTTSIDLNFATLNADNAASTVDLPDGRLNNSANITFRGGTLNILGRAQTASVETLGPIVLESGYNVINPAVGGTGINSMEISSLILLRTGGMAATLQIAGTNLGTIGSSSRFKVDLLNGIPTDPVTFGAGLTNKIVGGWAETGNDFLTYIPGLGFAALNQAGAPQYDLNNSFLSGVGTDNVRLTSTTAIGNGGANVNAVSMSGSNIALNFATGTDTLNLTSGGLIGPNNNQSIGATLDSGRLTAGGAAPGSNSDLCVFNRANTLTINSRIIDNVNGGGSAVRAVFTASGGAITLVNPNNSYTGGTVVNGGTLNLSNAVATAVIPAGGLELNAAVVTMNNSAGQIAAANVVTLNGSSALNLYGDNTVAGLVFNNQGGGAPSIGQTTAANAGAGAIGVLTIGAAGVVATSSNVGSTSILLGRMDFGTTPNTITVDPIMVNGIEVAPLQAALDLRGLVGSSGGITKLGAGVLQVTSQQVATGAFTVAAGGLRIGTTNAGSRYSAYTLDAGTTLNLNGQVTTLGSLAGSGTVFNSGGANTLSVGFNNTSTTFSGQLSRYNDAVLNAVALQKIGTGVMTMASAQNFATGTTGTITVSGGGLRYASAGAAFAGTTGVGGSGGGVFTVNTGGTLTVDNSLASGSNVNHRLGLNLVGTLNLQGGALTIEGNGNDASDTIENIATFNLANGGGIVTLKANAGSQLNLALGTLSGENATGTGLIRGIDATAAAGNATLTIATPNLIGGQGTGLNGSSTMPVRRDLLADASVTGLGTGFLVRDTTTGAYRALGGAAGLASTEYNLTPATWAATQNAGINATTVSLAGNRSANTLTIGGASTLDSALAPSAFGLHGPGGALLTQSLVINSLLALDGSVADVNVGALNGTAGTSWAIHTVGNAALTMNGYFGLGNTGGFIKAGAGTLNFNRQTLLTGTVAINGGTVNLNSGQDHTLVVTPGATTPTLTALNLNGIDAVLDLKNSDQAVGALSAVNPLPGNGGTVTNSGGSTVTLSTAGGTFSGVISGNVAFTRAGSATTLLTNANTYNGATIVRGGILQLRDSGSILASPSLNLQYGTLFVDQFGLNPAGNLDPARISASAPVTLQGGTLTLNGAGSVDSTLTVGSVTVTGGGNTINVLPSQFTGGTAKITIGNLVRTANQSVVNFNGFAGTSSSLGGQGLNLNGDVILNQINGSNFTAANLNRGLIGGWAVADANTFATYVNGYGVSQMGVTAQGIVAPAFTSGTLDSATVITGNYSDGGTARTLTGTKAANSWRVSTSTATTYTLSANTAVTLGVGLITNSNAAINFTGTDATSTITAETAGSDLVVFVNQNTTSIGAKLIGDMNLVKSGGATLALNNSAAVGGNTFTGGTFVQQGTLNLNAAAGVVTVPGDLTINNAAVTMNTTAPGQIAATSNVSINGGGTLTFPNYASAAANTLASLSFNNTGGTGNPTVSLGTPTTGNSHTLVLTAADAITSSNDSFATTPVISTGSATLTALQFSNANPVITTSGLSPNSLTISATITPHAGMTGPLSKSGLGSLALSGANTFNTGFNLNQGSLIFGANSAGTLPTVTSGPIGTGTLAIAGGTTLLSDGTVRTIGNATTVNGDFTIGGRIAGNGVTLSGAMQLGTAGRTLTVTSPAVTATISGAITSTATGIALTKAGAGTLVLTRHAGTDFGGAGVAVTGGIFKAAGADNAIPIASAMAVSAGAGYDLNGFNQTLDGISGAGFITNSANNTRTLAIDSAANNSSFSGVLTDNRIAQSASRLAVVKNGAATLTFDGGEANTYSGLTTVTAGRLDLNKTPNVNAIIGDGASSKVTADVLIDGGELRLAGNHQLDDSVFVNMTSGTFNVNGRTDTVFHFANSGGAYRSSRGSALTVIDPTWSGGSNDVFGNDVYGDLTISGGTNTIHGDETTGLGAGSITVGAGGLTFSGTASPSLIVSSDSGAQANAARLMLNGNVSFTGTSGTATITNGVALQSNGVTPVDGSAGPFAGTVDLGASSRTFTIADGSAAADMDIGARIAGNGGLVKAGAGTLLLSGSGSAASPFTGPTIVTAGTLEIRGSISGTSALELDPGASVLISGIGGERINDAATVDLNGGTLAFSGSLSGITETLGALSLNANSILDFGLGDTNTFLFGNLAIAGSATLSIYNWTGTGYALPPEADTVENGHLASQDRLLFGQDVSGQALSQISFYSDNGLTLIGSGAQIDFGSNFEIVPVPEPSSMALLGAAGLLAFGSYRHRRRLARTRSQRS